MTRTIKKNKMDCMFGMHINREMKNEAEELFGNMDMTLAHAIRLFLRQCLIERGLPFKLMVHEDKE